MAKRRSKEEVVADTLKFAKRGAFTPKELADHIGFTSNRARQVLDGLVASRKLTELGKRRGGRGKPATLYGLRGTKVTESDLHVSTARKAPTRRAPRTQRSVEVGTSPAGEAFADLLGAIRDEGLVIEGPAGLEFVVRLGGSEPRKRAPVRRTAAKRPAKKKAAKKKASKKAAKRTGAAKKGAAKRKAAKKPSKKAAKRTAKKGAAKKAKRKTAAKKRAKSTKAKSAKRRSASPKKRRSGNAKRRTAKKAPEAAPETPVEATVPVESQTTAPAEGAQESAES